MSSQHVVTNIMNFITANLPTENAYDTIADYDYFNDFLEDNSITGPWLGVEFVGQDEVPITIGANNTSGKYREIGSVFLHVAEISRLGVGNAIRTRATTITNAFRGQRIGDIIITSVTTPNFSSGTTLNLDGGYTSATMMVYYERDNDL